MLSFASDAHDSLEDDLYAISAACLGADFRSLAGDCAVELPARLTPVVWGFDACPERQPMPVRLYHFVLLPRHHLDEDVDLHH